MNGLHLASLATASILLLANVVSGADRKQEQLARLVSYGFLITSSDFADSDTRIVVPHDSTAGRDEINELMNYCANYSPKTEIVFFGPVIVEEQFLQFCLYLPECHPRHMAAVGLGLTFTVPDGEKERRVLHITEVDSRGKEIGLRIGDSILGIGDYRWPEADSYDSYWYALKRQLPGDKSTIVVKRNDQIISLPVTWRESGPSILLTKNADNKAVNRSTQSRGN
jgi:predicted metalloprotease with PDZ domain